MPSCSIAHCKARKNKNQPQLTLHKFPNNEVLRRRWINVIGSENINPRHKNWFVCSLHFEETCFNKTLNIMRLHDYAIPSLSLVSCKERNSEERQNRPILCDNIQMLHYEEQLKSYDENTNTNYQTYSAKSSATTSVPESAASTIQKSEHTPNTSNSMIEVHLDKIKKLTKTCQELRKKVKVLNERLRRRDKKIARLAQNIEDLRSKKKKNFEETILLEECAGSEDFLKRQITKARDLPLEKKYSEDIRKFALTLHFFSPRAYNYVRNKYNTCLPHTRTLRNWYKNVNAEPGFTEEAFTTLKMQAEQSHHPLVCALIIDEMAIRKGLIWDAKGQKFYGRVDYDHNNNNDGIEEANQALVFLITCINGTWKLPIGYFLITSLTGEQKCGLVQTAIKLCEDAKAKIVSLTCDGPACNISMLSALGCKISNERITTTFVSSHSLIHAFIDPCHAIKLIRNTFGELKLLYDVNGRKIDFTFLENLQKLQETEGLHMANKLTKAHISFEKQKMKVRLATQLLSNSVADALEYCRTKLKLKDFQECEGTVNFINIINDVFDVLNSHSIRPPGWKKAMCLENIGLIRALFENAIEYIKTIKLPSGQRLIESRRKTGFIGLIVCMKSAMEMFENLVEKKKCLKYIALYKVSQDHLELFFSAIRARGGHNNNPNAVQFRAAYKKLLIRSEIRDGGVGNCIPLDQVNILTCTSKSPVNNINELTAKKSFVDIPDDHSDLYEAYTDYLQNECSEYTHRVLEYVAGYVSRKISHCLKCDTCVSLLLGTENMESLIFKKTRGGLRYATPGVLDILKKTENLLKPYLNEHQKSPEKYYMYIIKFLVEFYDTGKILYIPNDAEHNTNHRLLLIKSIVKVYIDLRFRHYSKLSTDKISYRNYFNKLTLFRNE